jgi:hypothetical protein
MTFKDDIINVLCNTCDDHFCKRNDDDIVSCISTIVERDEYR